MIMNKIHRLFSTFVSLLVATTLWADVPAATFEIEIAASTNGTVATTPTTTYAFPGATITLTVTPAANYYLSKLTVTPYEPGESAHARRRSGSGPTMLSVIPITTNSDGTYSFIMPDKKVVISAEFSPCASISDVAVTLVNSDERTHVFDWLSHTPSIYSVTLNSGATILYEGTDYTVSSLKDGFSDTDENAWEKGVTSITNVGTRKIRLTGIGKFNGTKDVTYTITARNLAGVAGTGGYAAANVQLAKNSTVFTHHNQKPVISGAYMNGQTLALSTDYTVTTDINSETAFIDAKKYSIVIQGTGNFNGTISETYTIEKMPISDCSISGTTSFAYDGNVHMPTSFTLNDGVDNLTTDDYSVSYDNDNSTDVGTYTMTITAKEGRNYTGSKNVTYSITSAGFVIEDISNQTYTGGEIEPVLTVKDGTKELTKGTHYTVVYSNNKNVGTAKVAVIGKNSYNGELSEKTFTITQRDISDASVSITLSNTSLTFNGNEQRPNVTVTNTYTSPGASSSTTENLTENKDYTFSGQTDQGTYTVTITGKGNFKGTKTTTDTYTISPLSITNDNSSITLSYNSRIFNGSNDAPGVEKVFANGILLEAGTDYVSPVTYSSSTGGTDITNQGTKKVTITGKGNYSGSITTEYTITPKALTDDMVTLPYASTEFTGSAITPVPTISDKPAGTELISTEDYDITYSNNINVGTATVIVTAKRNYSGVVKKTFQIVEKNASGVFTVALAEPSTTFVYNGTPHTPGITVTKTGTSTVLNSGTDYTFVYSNNTNAGTATITVTGKGNYSGTATLTFTIQTKPLTTGDVVLSATEFNYNGSLQKPIVTVKDGTKTLVQNVEYTIVNDGGVNANNYVVSVTGIGNYSGNVTPNFTINKISLEGANVVLNNLGSYVYDGNAKTPGVIEVKIGAAEIPAANYDVSYTNNINAGTATVTVTGKNNCVDETTATATFIITPKPVTSDMVTISPTTFNFDNTLHRPTTITVKDGEKTMGLNTDYTLTNTGGTAIGTYNVTITGEGNYTGTASKSYSIVVNDASGFSVSAIEDQTYDGTPKTPAPVVKEGETTLTTNYYTVAYLNNINAGTAVVTVTGKNGYNFVKSQTFTIQPKALNTDMLTLSSATFAYNGSVQKPTVTMADLNAGNPIITSNDYIVTNEGGTDVNTYTVSVTGKNNYTGTISKTFTITPLNISTATITLATLASYVYDGAEKTPAVQLVKVGELVVPSSAYNVAHSNNINVGSTATVTVTAKTGTNFTGSCTTTFSIEKRPVTADMIILSSENLVYTGSNQAPTVTVKIGGTTLAEETDYTVDIPAAKDVANYWITVTGKGNYTGNAVKQFSIVAENSAAFDVSAISPAEITFTGLPIEPTVTVWKAGDEGGTPLVLGTDYLVTYSDNLNAGTATVTVSGQGNYGGTRRVTFTIVPKAIAEDAITLSQTSYNYNGTEQRPYVTVTDGTKTLKENADYTVDYPVDTKSQGTKTLTIKGIGNYQGTWTKTYTIGTLTIANASVTLTYDNTVYNGTPQKPTVLTVYANGIQLTEGVDYTVSYPTDAEATSQGNKNIVINGAGNYSGLRTVTYQIAPKPVTTSMITLSSENLIYTGSLLKPEVTVKDGNLTMTKDTDYTLTNDGGTNYGTYNVVITGKGNYTGEAIKTYSIVRKDVSDFTVSAIADMIYDGTAKQPLPEVKDHMNKLMTRGTDFLISYSNNTNAGTATATVTGINSYSGTKSVEFIILPKSLTVTDGTVEVTLSKTALPYTGSLQRPEVIVKDGSKTLVQNTDYTIINDGGVANGSYEVKITGIGNYKDVVTKTYTIGKTSLEGATVILNRLDSYVYDGTAKTPSVSEVKVEASSISSANYTVTYTNNVDVGTATVTVTATETGNCTGSATATFAITPKTVNSEMIAFTPAVFSYDGNLHKPETVTVKDGTSEMTQDTDYTLVNEGGTALGTYSVTIIGKGNYAGSASKSFSIAANDASAFVIEGVQDVVFDGSEQKPVPVVKDGDMVLDPKYYNVAYMNNVDAGTAVVTVSGKDGYSFIKSKVFNIAPKTLTADMMSLSETNFVYNGSLQKPVVTMSDGGSLTANDYTLSNEGGINNGTYRVVATGQSNYTGTVEKTYTIGQFSLAEATVILSPLSNAIYDGNAKTPGVIEVQIGTVVVSPDNYIVSYENNTHAGTATVTVTAKEPSNCTGSITTTFTITPKTVTSEMIELSPSFLNYDGTLQKPSLVTVKDGALSMTKDTDYTLINEGGTTVGSYQVTITGKGDYTGTASKSYSIVSNDASGFSIDAIDDLTFDGTEKTPIPVVKDENGSTIPADGYSVTYLNNVNAGTAFVTVMGKNGYSFIKSQMFTIKPKQLTADMVSLSTTEFIYNGSIQRPVVTITDGGTGEASLITNSDYILINDGGANIGTYQVVVNGQNNYTGTVEMTYSISLLTLSDATITLGTNSFVYDGTAKEPLVQLVNVGQVIVTSSDYSVAYSDNVNVGQAKVTITGKGNYSGSKTVYFTITPKSLTNDMVTLTPSSVVYNEKLQKPVVTVKDGQTVLVENVDYTLTNDGGTEAGNYTVYIAGIGNYGGTILATFTIEGPDMVAEIDGTNEKGYQTKGSANIRPTKEDGDEAEIVSFNDSSAPGQLPTTSITIPATSTSGGKTYTITGIADGAFANMSNLKDVFLPETESPLTIGENAFPEDVVIHVPLALLDDYALMPTLESYFKDNKVMSTVKVSNRLWTFSSGVDVAVPDNVSVYVVHERNDNSVTIIELSDEELMVGGQRIIKANNGVLFECKGFVSEYDLIASAVRMSSGTTISTDDHKDYGQKNCLEPVIESKHYESGNYYFLKNNEFYHVKSESESLKVPAGKAVLYLKQQATTRGYSHVLSIVGEDGKIEPEAENGNGMDAGDWYDMNGRKLEGVPIRKGVYIRNNQKIVIK